VVVGGDFNLIRGAEDKNNSNINWPRVHLFNDCIARLALRELNRSGARFTWTNKQVNPVRSVLDRVFISPSWETHLPMASLSAETRIGSDHTPLILDSGEGLLSRSNRFFFETSWLALPNFKEVLQGIWSKLLISPGRRRDTIDSWHIQSASLRHYLKGWGANRGKLEREAKAHILAQIQSLDTQADASGLDEDEWALRYHLEDELMQILCAEEEYWRQRGRQNWLLQGAANTAYFHAIANGRRRKCAIRSLQSEEGEITGPAAIQEHIYKFYMGLMGTEDPKFISLQTNCWTGGEMVADEIMQLWHCPFPTRS
jgi:mannosylglycoprotein endo-beta-mannosidase